MSIEKEELLKEINRSNEYLLNNIQGTSTVVKTIDLIQKANELFKEKMVDVANVGLGEDPYSKIKNGVETNILRNKEFQQFINSDKIIHDEFLNLYLSYRKEGFPIPSNEKIRLDQRETINKLFECCYELSEGKSIEADEYNRLKENVDKIRNYYKLISLNPQNNPANLVSNLFEVVKSKTLLRDSVVKK